MKTMLGIFPLFFLLGVTKLKELVKMTVLSLHQVNYIPLDVPVKDKAQSFFLNPPLFDRLQKELL